MNPSNPQNGLDVIGTFVMAGLYSVILYIIINVIVQGVILLIRILH